MKDQLPEAPVTMFTNYKRVDGFEVSVTLRGSELKEVATLLDSAIAGIIKSGGTPVIRGAFPKQQPKPIEYAEGTCPLCQSRVVKGQSKDGTKKFEKCETGKYNFQTKQQEGCQFIKWL